MVKESDRVEPSLPGPKTNAFDKLMNNPSLAVSKSGSVKKSGSARNSALKNAVMPNQPIISEMFQKVT